eukprot:CFRG3909T1
MDSNRRNDDKSRKDVGSPLVKYNRHAMDMSPEELEKYWNTLEGLKKYILPVEDMINICRSNPLKRASILELKRVRAFLMNERSSPNPDLITNAKSLDLLGRQLEVLCKEVSKINDSSSNTPNVGVGVAPSSLTSFFSDSVAVPHSKRKLSHLKLGDEDIMDYESTTSGGVSTSSCSKVACVPTNHLRSIDPLHDEVKEALLLRTGKKSCTDISNSKCEASSGDKSSNSFFQKTSVSHERKFPRGSEVSHGHSKGWGPKHSSARKSRKRKVVKIKTVMGEVIDLKVRDSDTVQAVKERLAAIIDMPVHLQSFVYNGAELKDNRVRMDHLGISDGSSLTLVPSLQSGLVDSIPLDLHYRNANKRDVHQLELQGQAILNKLSEVPELKNMLFDKSTVLEIFPDENRIQVLVRTVGVPMTASQSKNGDSTGESENDKNANERITSSFNMDLDCDNIRSLSGTSTPNDSDGRMLDTGETNVDEDESSPATRSKREHNTLRDKMAGLRAKMQARKRAKTCKSYNDSQPKEDMNTTIVCEESVVPSHGVAAYKSTLTDSTVAKPYVTENVGVVESESLPEKNSSQYTNIEPTVEKTFSTPVSEIRKGSENVDSLSRTSTTSTPHTAIGVDRCHSCRAKLPFIRHACKCELFFCSSHRHDHECHYTYKQ